MLCEIEVLSSFIHVFSIYNLYRREVFHKFRFSANCAIDRTVLRSKTDAERSERTL